MTKQTEALRMAIEDLEVVWGKDRESVIACREALEQPIHQRWNIDVDGNDLLVCEGGHDKNEACNFIRYSPPKAETQEPMIIKTEIGMTLKLGYEDLPNGTAFYTTPPSREWQSLSDEDIDAIFPLGDDVDVLDVARGIEAKLKEKNNA